MNNIAQVGNAMGNFIYIDTTAADYKDQVK